MTGKTVKDIFDKKFPDLAKDVVKWVDHYHGNISVLTRPGKLYKFSVKGKNFILEGVL